MKKLLSKPTQLLVALANACTLPFGDAFSFSLQILDSRSMENSNERAKISEVASGVVDRDCILLEVHTALL